MISSFLCLATFTFPSFLGVVALSFCQLTINVIASFKHSQLVHHLRIRLVTMAVYRVVALLADPDAVRCVKMHSYPTSDAFATEVANHFSPFLALATHKKGVVLPHTGQGLPPLQKMHKKATTAAFLCVVVFVVKRSVVLLLYIPYATATFSRLRLCFRFGFASASSSASIASNSASVGSASGSTAALACLSCSCCSFALLLIIGMTTT